MRLPSAAIAAESLAGLAALIAVSTSPSVVAAPRSTLSVVPSASVIARSLPLAARTPLPSLSDVSFVRRVQREHVGTRRRRFAATLMPPAPDRRPSCRRRLPARASCRCRPRCRSSANRSPSTTAVTLDVGVVVDRVEHVVDGAGSAQIDVGRVAGAIGDANLARGARPRRR